jgi:RecA-family ATPase
VVEVYIDALLSSDGGGRIGGEEKLGKSYYALHEALSLALGLPVCGRFTVPARRRVLFVEEEDSSLVDDRVALEHRARPVLRSSAKMKYSEPSPRSDRGPGAARLCCRSLVRHRDRHRR